MDDEYIISHLKALQKAMRPKAKAYAYKNEHGKYVFGSKGKKGLERNVVERRIAIFLIVGNSK